MNELPVHNFIFNIVAGIVQTFIKSWNQLLYPRVIEVCRLPFEPRHHFFMHLIVVVELPLENARHHCVDFTDSWRYHKQQQSVCEFLLDVHLLRWEIVWRNAPRIWRDFGSALPFQTRLTQTKSVLPLSKEHGSQVKDQGRRQCCHNKHKNFPIVLHVMYLYFPDTPRMLKSKPCMLNGNLLYMVKYSVLDEGAVSIGK